MPIRQYKDFDSCVIGMMSKKNESGEMMSKEEATAACKEMEKPMMNEKRLLSEIEFGDISDSELETKEFEILSAGKKTYRGGVINITENDLSELEKNFNDNVVGTQLAVDINHDDDHRAVAWFKSVRKVGNKLLATFKDFSEEGKKLVLEKHYKYFSVEFESGFSRVIDGVKKTFNNVLRGVALTNRPVDKDLAPTFMSDKLYSLFNQSVMLKKLAEHLQKKAKLTPEEKTLWSETVKEFGEIEDAELKKLTDEVETKPVEEVKEEGTPPADETEAEEEKKELAEKYEKKLSEVQSELSKLKTERRKEKLSERCEKEVQLSEKCQIGLSKEDTSKFSEFVTTLSDKQIEAVFDFMKKIKHVDFSEKGSSGNGADSTDELNKLAEEKMKASPSLTLGEAYKKVLSERPDLGKNL